MQHQADISELIPKGLGKYWLMFLAGASFIALLETAHLYQPQIADTLGVMAVPALDISRRDSVLNWFVSILLFTTSAVAYINYKLGRKYKDPLGITAAWFWMSLGLLYISLDTQVALRHTLGICLTQWSGTPLYGNGTVWWLIVYLFFFGVIGTRVFSAMLPYPFTLGLFLLSVTGIIVDIVLGLSLLPNLFELVPMIVLQTAVFAIAVLFLFLSCTLFARRQVFRDPDVALQWFARHWKHETLFQKINEQEPVPKEPAEKPVIPIALEGSTIKKEEV